MKKIKPDDGDILNFLKKQLKLKDPDLDTLDSFIDSVKKELKDFAPKGPIKGNESKDKNLKAEKEKCKIFIDYYTSQTSLSAEALLISFVSISFAIFIPFILELSSCIISIFIFSFAIFAYFIIIVICVGIQLSKKHEYDSKIIYYQLKLRMIEEIEQENTPAKIG